MYKSLKELTPFLRGCCGFWDVDGKSAPMRFTPSQLDYFKSIADKKFFNISACSAGISLAFLTDAREIAFDYSIGDITYVTNSGIDIYENRVFAAHFAINKGDKDIRISYSIKSAEPCEIEIHFPGGVHFFPYNFSLGNISPLPRKDKLALFYGSSSTQSAYISHPSFSWPEIIARFLDAEYINRGTGSYYYDAESLPEKSDCKPDYVFIMYGGNDILLFPTIEDALREAKSFIQKAASLYPSAKIMVLSPEYMRKEPMDEKMRNDLEQYCAALPALCDTCSCTFLSTKELIPDLASLFLDDDVHFNEAGMGQFTCNLMNKLKSII